MSSCSCITQTNKRCRNYAVDGQSRCATHADLDIATWKKRYFKYFTLTSVYQKGKLSIATYMLLQEGIQLTSHDLQKYTTAARHEDLLIALAKTNQIPVDSIPNVINRLLIYSHKVLPLSGHLGALYQIQHLNFFFEANPHLMVRCLFAYINRHLDKYGTPERRADMVLRFKQYLLEFMRLQQVRRSAWYIYTLESYENQEVHDLFAYFLQLLKDVRAQEKLLLRQTTFLYKEELVMKVFHPSQLEKWFAMGYGIDDLDGFGW